MYAVLLVLVYTASRPLFPIALALSAVPLLISVLVLVMPLSLEEQISGSMGRVVFDALQIGLDLLFLTFLIVRTDDLLSPFLPLLIFPILESALLYEYRGGLAAFLAATLFLGVQMVRMGEGEPEFWVRGFTHTLLFLITAVSAAFLTRRFQGMLEEFEVLRLDRDSLLRALQSGILVMDRRGRVLYDNPSAREILGREGYAEVRRRSLEALESGTFGDRQEFPLRDRIIGLSVWPLIRRGQRTEGVVAVLQDVTEYKAMERRMRELDRWMTIGNFSAHMAHEIRSSLMGILGSVRLLTRKADQKMPALRVLERETRHLNRLVEQFLEYARLSRPPELQATPLSELLAYLPEELRPEQVDDAHPASLVLQVEPFWLEIILRNLLENARRYDPHPVHRVYPPGTPVPSPFGEIEGRSDRVAWVIRDQGPGIPEDQQARVFEPFFTTEPQGFGLGLAVVRQAVDTMGWDLTFRSRPGRGTEFVIWIPVVLQTQEETPHATRADSG
ncbi:MAG: ATP-binding protein [Candidatus Hydrothermae bacterium]|nr:ATP-binding protein [Candidatus Hydrothermae bacterium]